MKYHGEYELLPAFVDGTTIKWQVTGCGEYVLGIALDSAEADEYFAIQIAKYQKV